MRNMSNSPAPTWKKIVAAILDFLTVFIGGGLAIASFTGDTTENGFFAGGRSGPPAFGVMAAYFIVLPRLGGTIWQRILKTR